MSLLDNLHFAKGIDPVADAFSGTVYTDIYSMKNHKKALFQIYCGVGTTGTSTITAEACDDVSASNATAVPFRYREITSDDTQGATSKATASGFTTTAGSSRIVLVEVDAMDLASTGYEFVRLKLVESANDPVLGGVSVMMAEPRYAKNVQDTVLS